MKPRSVAGAAPSPLLLRALLASAGLHLAALVALAPAWQGGGARPAAPPPMMLHAVLQDAVQRSPAVVHSAHAAVSVPRPGAPAAAPRPASVREVRRDLDPAKRPAARVAPRPAAVADAAPPVPQREGLDAGALRGLRVGVAVALAGAEPPATVPRSATAHLLFAGGGRLLAVRLEPGSGDAALDAWLIAQLGRAGRRVAVPDALAAVPFELSLPLELGAPPVSGELLTRTTIDRP